MVHILTLRDRASISSPRPVSALTEADPDRHGPDTRLSSSAEPLSRHDLNAKGPRQGSETCRGAWRAENRDGKQRTEQGCRRSPRYRQALAPLSRGWVENTATSRPYDQEQAAVFRTHRPLTIAVRFRRRRLLYRRRREQTASRTLKFSRGEVGQDDPKRFPREPPGPPSPPGVAVIVNVSACSIEFTHSEFSFSVVVHPA